MDFGRGINNGVVLRNVWCIWFYANVRLLSLGLHHGSKVICVFSCCICQQLHWMSYAYAVLSLLLPPLPAIGCCTTWFRRRLLLSPSRWRHQFAFLSPLSGGDSCHLVLPPGCVVGVGIIDGNPEAFGELKFNKIEFMSTEGKHPCRSSSSLISQRFGRLHWDARSSSRTAAQWVIMI